MAKNIIFENTSEQRSKTMRAIRNKDTKIEMSLRRALYRKGLRYRKNYSRIFGHPDIAFTKSKIVVFCDSEFWHGESWEKSKRGMKNNIDYWNEKIERNKKRDLEVNARLNSEGYLVLRYWANRIEKNLAEVVSEIEKAIASRSK